eukprot:765730-Hanusia_phi.AAC.3
MSSQGDEHCALFVLELWCSQFAVVVGILREDDPVKLQNDSANVEGDPNAELQAMHSQRLTQKQFLR